MFPKLLKTLFISIIILFQYQLWFAEVNIFTWFSINRNIKKEQQLLNEAENQLKTVKDRINEINVKDEEIEAIARREHGLIKKDEIFVKYD